MGQQLLDQDSTEIQGSQTPPAASHQPESKPSQTINCARDCRGSSLYLTRPQKLKLEWPLHQQILVDLEALARHPSLELQQDQEVPEVLVALEFLVILGRHWGQDRLEDQEQP